jgi:hypothetical protein
MEWKPCAVILLSIVLVAILAHLVITSSPTCTISAIKARGLSGQTATLRGRVVEVDANRFVLDDGTGTIEMATCPAWYREVHLSVGDEVTVTGRVTSVLSRSDLSVNAHKIVRGKEVIRIRGSAGKPPWTAAYRPGTSASR